MPMVGGISMVGAASISVGVSTSSLAGAQQRVESANRSGHAVVMSVVRDGERGRK
jgi:hypothetical protein